MSSLQEIESAISGLSSEDQAKLIEDLPALLPEWKGDLAWHKIVHDTTPSKSLTAFVDAVDADYRRNPEAFPEIKDADFKRNS